MVSKNIYRATLLCCRCVLSLHTSSIQFLLYFCALNPLRPNDHGGSEDVRRNITALDLIPWSYVFFKILQEDQLANIVSGQISIIPKPELRGFWGSSLIQPPFG